ncbi:MAG: hypothetical protein KY466_11635 [Gemmatimonadetes bacterium]|nr:hypothetical protein [Gemmatimonadota bacterium]
MPGWPRVSAGSVVVLRLYDVAYEIDLAAVETMAADQLPTARLRLSRAEPKAIAYGSPPVVLDLGSVELAGVPVPGTAFARIYDFGALSLWLRFDRDDLGWDEFTAAARAIDRAAAADGGAPWADLMRRVVDVITPALEQPSDARLEEDYLLAIVRSFDRPMTGEAVLHDLDLVPFLSGEDRELAASARAELLRNAFSYYTDDLAVLTWDRAFLYEPRGDTDVADVLEVANAQLLELRYYDDRLDRELPRMYDRVAHARTAFAPLAMRRNAHLARQLHALVAEVTELTEKVENALKVTEDVYLARIYAAALDLFRVRPRGAAVDRKLTIIRDTYTALFDEAATARAEVLEATIVALIVFEIVMAFAVG